MGRLLGYASRGRRAITLSRTFIVGQEGRDRCPLINMYLNDDQVIVLGFQTDEQGQFEVLNQGQFEVLNRIYKGRPNFVMTLEMIAKVWAETAWNNGVEVGFGSNMACARLQESAKLLQA